MKKLITLVAILLMATGAQAQEDLKLKLDPYPWNYTYSSPIWEITFEEWGEYYLLSAPINPKDYKGFRIKYTGFPATVYDDNGWIRYVQVRIGEGLNVQHTVLDAYATEAYADFNEAVLEAEKIQTITIQGIYAGVKIQVKDFSLVKADGTEESIWPGTGWNWGLTKEPAYDNGPVTFTGQWGALEIQTLAGEPITYIPGESEEFFIDLTFGGPLPNSLMLELDDDTGAGFRWVEIPAGSTNFTLFVNDGNCTNQLAKLMIKANAEDGYPFDVVFSSITLTSESNLHPAEDDELAIQTPNYIWNATFSPISIPITFSSEWGEYGIIGPNNPFNPGEYKGFRIEYEPVPETMVDDNGWKRYVQVKVQDNMQFFGLDPYATEVNGYFGEAIRALETIDKVNIQGMAAGTSIKLKAFYLIKNDDTLEQVTNYDNSGGWGHTTNDMSFSGKLTFTGQYGGVSIVEAATGADVTFTPGGQAYKYVIELAAPTENSVMFEANNDEGGIAWFGLPAGLNQLEVEISDATCPSEMTKLMLKANSEKGYPFDLNIKSIYRLPLKQEPAGVPGDANGDGFVTITDATAVVEYILSGHADPFVFENADVNGDGSITATDATLIIDMILNP